MSNDESQVYINQMTSNIHVVDASAMLTPEAIAIIQDEVRRQLELLEEERRDLEDDMMIQTRATHID